MKSSEPKTLVTEADEYLPQMPFKDSGASLIYLEDIDKLQYYNDSDTKHRT